MLSFPIRPPCRQEKEGDGLVVATPASDPAADRARDGESSPPASAGGPPGRLLAVLLALALLYPGPLFQGRIFVSSDARNQDAFTLVGDAALARGDLPAVESLPVRRHADLRFAQLHEIRLSAVGRPQLPARPPRPAAADLAVRAPRLRRAGHGLPAAPLGGVARRRGAGRSGLGVGAERGRVVRRTVTARSSARRCTCRGSWRARSRCSAGAVGVRWR